jgi:hypothetical protein
MTDKYLFASACEQLKLSVWVKGECALGYNPIFYRRDVFGAWMQYNAHGNTLSHFGWEIAYIKPVEEGGTNELSNLQSVQWRNNRNRNRIAPQP